MQKIVPFLWFDGNAEEAMNFYVSVFKNSRVVSVTRYGDAGPGPKGTVMSCTFQLEGQDFYALNGGPQFKFTPAISLFVNCETQQEIDALWNKLSAGGREDQCGWLQDKYGLSWQVIHTGQAPILQKFTPVFMFVGDVCGKAEEAIDVYASVFSNAPDGKAGVSGRTTATRTTGTSKGVKRLAARL